MWSGQLDGLINRCCLMTWISIPLAMALAFTAADVDAHTKGPRSQTQRDAFTRLHPCPITGKALGACPGYVVDHIKPLCAGGADRPDNMQWLTRAEAKAKDRVAIKNCRKRGPARPG